MNDDRLWAPWRMDYIRGETGACESPAVPLPSSWLPNAEHSCFLCQAAASCESQPESDRQRLVVDRTEHSLIVLNRYPYNNGHALISPRRHLGELSDLSANEHLACLHDINRLMSVYREHMNAEGFNIGLNLGRVAGAGVPGHLHWHLVPRWTGDSNFMPVLAGSRVISQSLDALWELVSTELRNMK